MRNAGFANSQTFFAIILKFQCLICRNVKFQGEILSNDDILKTCYSIRRCSERLFKATNSLNRKCQKCNEKFFFVFSTVRGSRPGKNVQLTENEIRGLCLKSREIFLSQPILLELEAPLKICGKCLVRNIFHCSPMNFHNYFSLLQAIYMVNTTIF